MCLYKRQHANWHRKTISRQDVLEEIAEVTGWRGLRPFAEFLGVSEKTISKYLPQKYKDVVKSAAAKHGLALFFDEWRRKIGTDMSIWDCLHDRPEGYGSKEFHRSPTPTAAAREIAWWCRA